MELEMKNERITKREIDQLSRGSCWLNTKRKNRTARPRSPATAPHDTHMSVMYLSQAHQWGGHARGLRWDSPDSAEQPILNFPQQRFSYSNERGQYLAFGEYFSLSHLKFNKLGMWYSIWLALAGDGSFLHVVCLQLLYEICNLTTSTNSIAPFTKKSDWRAGRNVKTIH